jgi:competence protein ComEA
MRRSLLTTLIVCSALAGVMSRPAAVQTASQAPQAKTAETVNINTATPAQLEVLPGIGARTAARIVEYRQKNGPFKKIEDLMNVRGVGEKSFLRIKTLLTVGPARQERPAQAAPQTLH